MNSFLKSIEKKKDFGCVVLGNESCDMDSVVCSLCLSYFLSKTQEISVLPVLNVPRDELKYRCDILFILKECEVDEALLIFEPEVRKSLETNKENLEVILVDHNVSKLCWVTEDNVIEILDHHVDEKRYNPRGKTRVIEPVGSCATLVTLKIHALSSTFLKNHKHVAKLLHSTIMSDTVGLAEHLDRTTAKDLKVVKMLEDVLEITRKESIEMYELLARKKFDTTSLSDMEVLRGDYKGYGDYGIASGRREVVDEGVLEEFSAEMRIGLLIVMVQKLDKDLNFAREIVVYSRETELVKLVWKYLNEKGDVGLRKKKATKTMVYAVQDNLKISRKKLSPVVKTFWETRI